MSIQSSSWAGGRSKYEGLCEAEATWLKKTIRNQAGRGGPRAMTIAKVKCVPIFPLKKLQNALTGQTPKERFSYLLVLFQLPGAEEPSSGSGTA